MNRSILPMPPIIAALHLPPFPASGHPAAQTLPQIRDFALRNIEKAVRAGITAVYLQDLGDHPVARPIQPHLVAGMSAIGAAVHAAFPDLMLGISLMGHGAREPLAIAQAAGAGFVRLKVYVGAMVKAEGILEGCAADAIRYRHEIGAQEIAIYADVYDRTGQPLGRMPLVEECRQAYVFGRADALVLTGASFADSLGMVDEVRQAQLGAPLVFGGGVSGSGVAEALRHADGVIVSSAFKAVSQFTRESLLMDWDDALIARFMANILG